MTQIWLLQHHWEFIQREKGTVFQHLSSEILMKVVFFNTNCFTIVIRLDDLHLSETR